MLLYVFQRHLSSVVEGEGSYSQTLETTRWSFHYRVAIGKIAVRSLWLIADFVAVVLC